MHRAPCAGQRLKHCWQSQDVLCSSLYMFLWKMCKWALSPRYVSCSRRSTVGSKVGVGELCAPTDLRLGQSLRGRGWESTSYSMRSSTVCYRSPIGISAIEYITKVYTIQSVSGSNWSSYVYIQLHAWHLNWYMNGEQQVVGKVWIARMRLIVIIDMSLLLQIIKIVQNCNAPTKVIMCLSGMGVCCNTD